MSIAAAYLVSEGVVLGADSSTTVQIKPPKGKPQVVQLLTHSQKVFEVGEDSRLGLCTWGAGSYGNVSHRTIAARLNDAIDEKTTVEASAKKLIELVSPIMKESGVNYVGYYLGGQNPDHTPSCIKIEFIRKDTEIETKRNDFTLGRCEFSGTSQFFTRVFFGFAPELPNNLLEELNPRLAEYKIKDFNKIFWESFDNARMKVITEGLKDLPIREALDFVFSYLHITVKAEKFKFGAPSCGGPIEIGFITTDRPFRWARHKTFDSAIIEQEGTYAE